MLEIKGLYKSFGKTRAIDGLNLKIHEGEIFGFVGPNGAGKTTTMKIMTGLLKADKGEIFIDGVSILKNIGSLKEKVGYMPDSFGVYDNLKVMEYLEFYALAYGMNEEEGRKAGARLLDKVRLFDKKDAYVDELSRGMKQRLCLARALIHDPDILVLDEPASGLDPRSRAEFKEILKELKDLHKTIIISSHILMELAEICTSIGIIEKGEMILQGNIDDILTTVDSSNPLIINVYQNMEKAIEVLKKNPYVKHVSIQGNSILTTFMGGREDEALLLKNLIEHQVYIISFAREQSNLESLFLKITGNMGEEKNEN